MILSLLQPLTTASEINDNIAHLETNYDYKATITRNVLYPKGGTIDVGDTIFTKITTAIPFHLITLMSLDHESTIKGSHEVQLVVDAGGLWNRVFPLESKQLFDLTGTELAVIDKPYQIKLNEITTFIAQVEEETGIRADQYTIEVIPNIEGTISYAGKTESIPELGSLVFQLANDELILLSEKSFNTVAPFVSTEILTNTFNFFGSSLSLSHVRVISSILSILTFLSVIYLYTILMVSRKKSSSTQVDKINKKYGNRIIPVSQKINSDEKTMITLQSFKSIIQIADEKELPIFYHRIHQDGSALYFITDGDYLYKYETVKLTIARSTEEILDGDEAYAKG
ncbi:DUF5305 family protein [Sporosarcina jiandibaonis]|uniref:DUF5305 family protein n=1 Tax=Sporosarcina jiandibaonis TaxID=2715535 RepID=UPI0015547BCA|nr:DUF5305 family protein [Sporosarcina jiandibaonis]